MRFTHRDIGLHTWTQQKPKILSVCYTNRIYVVALIAIFGDISRFASEKYLANSVRKDTILDDPSRKTIRTNPSTVSEGKPMVQPFWLSEDYPVTGVNICLAVPRNGPQKIKPYVVGCSPRVRLCEVQRHCLFWGMYVLTKTFRNLHKRDDSTPYPRSNFNLSIGVS